MGQASPLPHKSPESDVIDFLESITPPERVAQAMTESEIQKWIAFQKESEDKPALLIHHLNVDNEDLIDEFAENATAGDMFSSGEEYRDEIIATVPSTTEQIHARQILLYNSDEANRIYDQLQAGTEFVTLVNQFEPITSGDLGWFPRGYLLVPELDPIIFDLEPGAYSPVIQTELGYHIVHVIEKDAQRPLTADARQVLQTHLKISG